MKRTKANERKAKEINKIWPVIIVTSFENVKQYQQQQQQSPAGM